MALLWRCLFLCHNIIKEVQCFLLYQALWLPWVGGPWDKISTLVNLSVTWMKFQRPRHLYSRKEVRMISQFLDRQVFLRLAGTWPPDIWQFFLGLAWKGTVYSCTLERIMQMCSSSWWTTECKNWWILSDPIPLFKNWSKWGLDSEMTTLMAGIWRNAFRNS